jgi:hypothetical protein
MSLFDKAVAAVTPHENQEKRAEARAKANAAAESGDWLSQILDHHLQLEDAFAAVKSAADPASRTTALKKLGVLLTGHAIAEEAVVYPGLAQAGEKGHAEMGYTEQMAVKMQMAELEGMSPMSHEFASKLEHIRAAVAHHMFEEEGRWFLELKRKAPADVQARLTQRYQAEFDRYVGDQAMSRAPRETRSWLGDQPNA